MELLSEYWVLKPSYQSVSVYDHNSNNNYIDFKKSGSCVVVVGTKDEILDKFRYMLRNHGWQCRDSFDIDTKPEWIELYNKKKECLILNAR
jgi:hypothetical protein